MAELRIVKKDDLTAIADKMREKLGGSDTVNFPDGFVSSVENVYSKSTGNMLDRTFAELNLENSEIDDANSWSKYTLAGANKLQKIILPSKGGTQKLPSYCFLNCNKLKTVETGSDNKWNFTVSNDSVFENCFSLEEIDFLNDSNNGIGNRAFYNCTSLKNVKPHYSETIYTSDGSHYEERVFCKNVGQYAFYNCTSLTEIDWLSNETDRNPTQYIYNYAFANSGITKIDLRKCNYLRIYSNAFENCNKLTEVILHPNTEINEKSFSNCKNLKSVTFDDADKKIDFGGKIKNYAFENCSSLEEIYIADGIGEIGNYAFSGCSSLKKVSFPYNMTTIGRCAFEGCPIEEIEFRDIDKSHLVTIDSFAFKDCNLLSITIPRNCQTIGISAFYGNTNLTSFNIADVKNSRLKTISDYAFRGCSTLKNFTVPSNVTKIGNYAFAYTGISYINFLPTTPPTLGSGFLYRTNNLEYIYVPKDENGGSYYVGLYSGVSGLSSSTYSKLITEWSETEETTTE